MERFTTLRGVAAPLMEDNLDTDVIYPARYLLVMDRAGLGDYAFRDRRFTADGAPRPEFVLNQPPFDKAVILVAGANFGSGSSREQAPWTLNSFGIRCVIASSFGEIFYANCFKNGMLPIVLPADVVARLAEAAATGEPFVIDLPSQQIRAPNLDPVSFDIPPTRKDALLTGWDDIDLILNNNAAGIDAFEARHRSAQPWLFAPES